MLRSFVCISKLWPQSIWFANCHMFSSRFPFSPSDSDSDSDSDSTRRLYCSFKSPFNMGGSFWSKDGLNTPRMPPDVYYRMLNHVKKQVRPLFLQVEHAVDAPEKPDFGDLDLLALHKPNLTADKKSKLLEHVAKELKAHRIEFTAVGLYMLALPWLDKESNPVPDKFVQLDLRIWEDKIDLDWSLFIQCNGDMINILAALIKHKGLTITDRALNVRIPETEKANKKAARVELTRDPKTVIEYLGLNVDRFFKPFETRDQLMTYMAGCRFHNPTCINRIAYEKDPEKSTEQGQGLNDAVKTTLNDYDRERLETRPMFAYWYQDFMPKHRDMPIGSAAHLTREETLEDVFQFFGDEVRSKYYKQKETAITATLRSSVFRSIHEALESKIPSEDMDDTMRGLRKIVRDEFEDDGDNEMAKLYNNDDFAGSIIWAKENHETALRRYRDWLETRAPSVKDLSKVAPYSTKQQESYSAEDDKVILAMKQENQTWPNILNAISKKSKSQLMAHWKQDLAYRVKAEKCQLNKA